MSHKVSVEDFEMALYDRLLARDSATDKSLVMTIRLYKKTINFVVSSPRLDEPVLFVNLEEAIELYNSL